LFYETGFCKFNLDNLGSISVLSRLIGTTYKQIERLHKLIGGAVVVARIVRVFERFFALSTWGIRQTYVVGFPAVS
jgi:hypothetical protein